MDATVRRRLGILIALLGGCASVPHSGTSTGYQGPVFDVHAHIEPTGTREHIDPKTPATVKALLAQMDEAQVAEAAAIVVPDQDPQAVQAANVELASASTAHPGRLVPVASIPSDDVATGLAELERVAKAGGRAVKVTPRPEPGDLARLSALAARAAELNVVILFDGWTLDLDGIAKLALAHPKAKFVVAHLGGVRFSDVLMFNVIRRYPFYARNVWFDLSSVAHLYAHSPYADQFTWVCRQVGTDRILFGSDFPLVPLGQAIADVRSLGFTADEQREILHDNAELLFGEKTRRAVTAAAAKQ